MKDRKKTLLNSIIFLTLIFITYYIIFREQNLYELYKQIRQLNIYYLLLAALVMLLYFIVEAYNIKSILTSFKEKMHLPKMLRYTLIGFFFSSITPGATGGQPMEVYYLTKEDIKVSHSTMALLIHLCGCQISSVSLGIIGIILKPHILDNGLIYFFIIGSLLNTIPITITIIGIFFPKLALKLVHLLMKLLKFLKIKNIEKINKKVTSELEIYQESANYIKNNKGKFIKAILVAFTQIIVYYTVPFLIYKSFGLKGQTIIDFIFLQAILHSTVCSMPLPGSVGVTETVFLLIYGLAYPNNLLQSALLVNRFVNFYLFVFISLIVYIFTKIKLDNEKNNL